MVELKVEKPDGKSTCSQSRAEAQEGGGIASDQKK